MIRKRESTWHKGQVSSWPILSGESRDKKWHSKRIGWRVSWTKMCITKPTSHILTESSSSLIKVIYNAKIMDIYKVRIRTIKYSNQTKRKGRSSYSLKTFKSIRRQVLVLLLIWPTQVVANIQPVLTHISKD